MSWLGILGIVVIIAAIAAIFGIKPDEGRPVARTRLMGAARVVLLIVGAILLWVAFF